MAVNLQLSYIRYDLWLARAIGDSPAKFISTLSSWEPKAACTYDGKPWVYKTLTAWAEELNLSVSGVRHVIRQLLDLGLIQKEKKRAHQWAQVCFYRVIPEALEELKSQFFKKTNRNASEERMDLLVADNSSSNSFKTNKSHSHQTSEPERDINRSKSPESNQERTKAKSPESNQESAICVKTTTLQSDKTFAKFSEKGIYVEDEKFYLWLVEKAKQLGKNHPPSWAHRVYFEPGPAILSEYQNRNNVRITPEFLLSKSSELGTLALSIERSELTPRDHLARLRAKWQLGRCQQDVMAEIANNPDWGLICDTEFGPALAWKDEFDDDQLTKKCEAEPVLAANDVIPDTVAAKPPNVCLGSQSENEYLLLQPVPAVAEVEILEAEGTAESHVEKLPMMQRPKLDLDILLKDLSDKWASRGQWICEFPKIRDMFRQEVLEEVSAHPEWGIKILPDFGPVIAEDLVDRPTENVHRINEPVVASSSNDLPVNLALPEIGVVMCQVINSSVPLPQTQPGLGLVGSVDGEVQFPVVLKREMIALPLSERLWDGGCPNNDEFSMAPFSEEMSIKQYIAEILQMSTVIGWTDSKLEQELYQLFSKMELNNLVDHELIAFHGLLLDLSRKVE
jgi:hypothetical protein